MNYYTLLELKPGASGDDIKQAYRRLAMKYHPDRTQGNKAAEELFKAIKEAYEKLSSANYTYVPVKPTYSPVQQKRYQNIVGSVPDAIINVTLENISNGVLAKASKKTICPICSGSGISSNTYSDRNGFTNWMYRNFEDRASKEEKDPKCKTCKGVGEVIDFDCYFDIPPGAYDGITMKLECKNNLKHSLNKTRNIQIRELNHPVFDRKGDDLYATITVNNRELLEGGTKTIHALNNKKLIVTIPMAIEDRTTLKLKGCGLPNLQTGELGNLYLTLKTL